MDMMNIVYAVAVLGALGGLFGLALALAGKIFFVKVDEREEAITGILPGANCGGCGFPGCAGCAAAMVSGTAAVNACLPGGNATAAKVADILGVAAEETEKMVAFVRCSGENMAKKYDYHGVVDCVGAMRVGSPQGPNVCANGCMGLGSCVKACRFGAISVVDGVARVDKEKCTGCMACAAACPKKLIVAVPYAAEVVIPCSNTDKGAVTRKICDVGCIACGICVKNCPNEAIKLENNVAVIDYSKCTNCGTCMEKCPRHIIRAAK